MKKVTIIRRPIQVYKIDVFCPDCSTMMLHNSLGQLLCNNCKLHLKLKEPVEGFRELQDAEPEVFDVEVVVFSESERKERGINVDD